MGEDCKNSPLRVSRSGCSVEDQSLYTGAGQYSPARDDDAFKDDIRKALHFTFASCLDEDERTALKGLDLWVWDK